MNERLSEKQIKKIIEKESKSIDSYSDGVDLVINQAVDLYEQQKIDEKTLKILVSLAFSVAAQETISNLSNNLIIKTAQPEEANKLLLVNYSKKSYA